MTKVKRNLSIWLGVFILGLLVACGANIENAKYNVLLRFPDNDKSYELGITNGLHLLPTTF